MDALKADDQSSSQSSSNIRVVCRMRPINALERSTGGETCIEFNQTKINCKVAGTEKPYDFTFDKIFGPGIPQKDIFEVVANPVIESVMAGYNGTIFCYGQTASGKTFTMEGPDELTNETKGLIPRMMDRVFEIILNSSEDLEFQIRVSFLEIYNEKIQDLLDPDKSNLQIKESKTRGIYVQDATEIYVTSAAEMSSAMKMGSANRTIAATRMNERSSRSHSLFYLQVFKKNLLTDTTTISKLYFIDLAGSEKISKTGVSGQQLEEAKNINKSLTCLGMVINALTSNGKEHVPYRDSKLTRVLQESLGGNAKTTLVINISMCSYNDKETLSTLRFGFRAKSIKNKPKKNEEKSAKELQILLETAENKIKYQEEIIQALQQQINGNRETDTSMGTVSSDDSFLQSLQATENQPQNQEPQPSQQQQQQQQEQQQQQQPQTPSKETNTGAVAVKVRQHNRAEGDSSASMKLLKQHIEMVKLREKIDEITLQLSDAEMQLRNKQIQVIALHEDLDEVRAKVKVRESEESTIITQLTEMVENERINKERTQESLDTMQKQQTRLQTDLQHLLVDMESMQVESIKEALQNALGCLGTNHILVSSKTSENSSSNSQRNISGQPEDNTVGQSKERLSAILIANSLSKHEIGDLFLTTETDDEGRLQTQESDMRDFNKLIHEELESDELFNLDQQERQQSVDRQDEGGNDGKTNSTKLLENAEKEEADKNIAEIMAKLNHNHHHHNQYLQIHQYQHQLHPQDNNSNSNRSLTLDTSALTGVIGQTISAQQIDSPRKTASQKTALEEEEDLIEEKLLALQETISTQHHKIKVLTDQCLQAQAKMFKIKDQAEERAEKFKVKQQKYKKLFEEKLQKYEDTIKTYHSIFGQMNADSQELKARHEKQLMEKNIKINELNEFVEDFKKNLKHKTPQHAINAQQLRINELMSERKATYLEVTKLRKANDELAAELKRRKSRDQQMQQLQQQQMSEQSQQPQWLDYQLNGKSAFIRSDSRRTSVAMMAQQQSFMKPSIRGGGGNQRLMNADKNIGNTLYAKVLDDEEELGEGDGDMQDAAYRDSNDRGSQNTNGMNLISAQSQFKKDKSSNSIIDFNDAQTQQQQQPERLNFRIINTEEEDSRPQAFNLHQSAKLFQQKFKAQTQQQQGIDSQRKSKSVDRDNSQNAGGVQQLKLVNEANRNTGQGQDKTNNGSNNSVPQQESGFFNRLKQFFVPQQGQSQ